MSYAEKIDKERKIDLSKFDPDDVGKAEKKECEEEVLKLSKELSELQELLYAAQSHSVLIVLQGPDSSGKDGTIAHVMAAINPQGCSVASFKIPTPEEKAHDFLWRAHKVAPAVGTITIFNRSHYEDVLVIRVHKIIDKEECERRYEQINDFEKLLAQNKTIIMKFYLHIDKDEQKERLEERAQDTAKSWKISVGDWQERKLWDQYVEAYENALSATATKDAPWYIIAANHKWYRNLAIAETIVKTLRPYRDDWENTLKQMAKERRAELKQFQEGKTPPAASDS